ncbi:MAG TPA: P-loop NTPase [Acidimicrobiales bacterium]|nr:P-loop NTPase [Acidimicrobiales bacterium]
MPSTVTDDMVTNALRGVIDPELGDNVVDLGMVAGFGPLEGDPDGRYEVRISLTTAGCPLRAQLMKDVRAHVGAIPTIGGPDRVKVTFGEMTAEQKRSLMDRARWKATQRDEVAIDIPDTARVVAISSGKGGVGKSSVTANLALAMAERGLTVGVLDADIGGFSIPRLLGMTDRVDADKDAVTGKARISPIDKPVGTAGGSLKVVSMGLIEGAEEDEAIMLRGLMLNRAVQHFLEDVRWGDLDYLLIDMPPGTSDIQMGLARMLPRTEVVVVTTPAIGAQKVAARAADMARKGHLRVAGVIENMSSFTCDHGETYSLFGRGGGERLSEDIGVPLLASLPLDPQGDALRAAVEVLAARIVTEAIPLVEMHDCTARLLDSVEAALGSVKPGR